MKQNMYKIKKIQTSGYKCNLFSFYKTISIKYSFIDTISNLLIEQIEYQVLK